MASLESSLSDQRSNLEPNPDNSKILFFSGNSMHDFGNRALKNALSRIYGQNNTQVIPSLFSKDIASKTRNMDIQQAIETILLHKEHGVIIVYSAGAVEFTKALAALINDKPESIENLNHLDIVVMCPAGFLRGWSEFENSLQSLSILDKKADDFSFSVALQALFHRHKRWWQRGSSAARNISTWARRYLPIVEGLTSPNTFLNWVETLNTFPPNPEIMSEEAVWDMLYTLYPEKSQRLSSNESVSSANIRDIVVPAENWRSLLSDEEVTLLDGIDAKISQFIDRLDTTDTALLEQLFRERATLLTKKNKLVYSGKPIPGNEGIEDEPAKNWKVLAQIVLGLASHREEYLSGAVIQQLKSLRDGGAKINFLIPEYDLLVELAEIQDFFPEEEKIILQRATHNTIANNTEPLAAALRSLKDARSVQVQS